MTPTKIATTARVRLLVEIQLENVWSGDCPLGQVYKQAAETGLCQLKAMLSSEAITQIGVAEVIAITTSMKP
jgi:hypothetical protein